eukprot:TRINITY_DN9024_c0_g1_i1.p1 TRINITY_DN9024_c0_g1~~TRINITY_DN9024_c0_g1_i1.p1  ORF type:complete len:128 (-),score=11.13 TRINITY_DN9024_c0_g1_i1:101-484(-)
MDRDELRKRLTPIQWHVTQEKGTERPFSGEYWNTKDKGEYDCLVCGQKLFVSGSKFDSGCGWPSFDRGEAGTIKENDDRSHGMIRTEVVCSKCSAHLGHVFDDGPTSTGQRYCINSASIKFRKDANL